MSLAAAVARPTATSQPMPCADRSPNERRLQARHAPVAAQHRTSALRTQTHVSRRDSSSMVSDRTTRADALLAALTPRSGRSGEIQARTVTNGNQRQSASYLADARALQVDDLSVRFEEGPPRPLWCASPAAHGSPWPRGGCAQGEEQSRARNRIARVLTVARNHVPASTQSPLLAPERRHRIDTRRSARRREAGDQRHEQEDARNSHQGRRIGGRDLEE